MPTGGNFQFSETLCKSGWRNNTSEELHWWLFKMQGLQTVVRYSSFKCSPSCKEALAGLVVTDSVSVENKKIKKSKTIAVFGYILRQHSQTPTVASVKSETLVSLPSLAKIQEQLTDCPRWWMMERLESKWNEMVSTVTESREKKDSTDLYTVYWILLQMVFLGVKVSQWYFACLADAVSADWKNHHKQS